MEHVSNKLIAAGLRPTRQRRLLGALLFTGESRHVTAESLHKEARATGIEVSLATVYNALHQFTDANLLHELYVEGDRSYFDTNVDAHHHFLCEDTGMLLDIPSEHIALTQLPPPPTGKRVSCINVVIRLRNMESADISHV